MSMSVDDMLWLLLGVGIGVALSMLVLSVIFWADRRAGGIGLNPHAGGETGDAIGPVPGTDRQPVRRKRPPLLPLPDSAASLAALDVPATPEGDALLEAPAKVPVAPSGAQAGAPVVATPLAAGPAVAVDSSDDPPPTAADAGLATVPPDAAKPLRGSADWWAEQGIAEILGAVRAASPLVAGASVPKVAPDFAPPVSRPKTGGDGAWRPDGAGRPDDAGERTPAPAAEEADTDGELREQATPGWQDSLDGLDAAIAAALEASTPEAKPRPEPAAVRQEADDDAVSAPQPTPPEAPAPASPGPDAAPVSAVAPRPEPAAPPVRPAAAPVPQRPKPADGAAKSPSTRPAGQESVPGVIVGGVRFAPVPKRPQTPATPQTESKPSPASE